MASIRAVSSIDTVSTQSKVSPSGNESSTAAVRSRMIGSTFLRLLGADTDRTVLRCSVCSGGSIAMNGVTSCCACSNSSLGRFPSEMPCAEENVCQSPSTARTSSYLVIDQNRPAVSSSERCTGSSARNPREVVVPAVLTKQVRIGRVDIGQVHVSGGRRIGAGLGHLHVRRPNLGLHQIGQNVACVAHEMLLEVDRRTRSVSGPQYPSLGLGSACSVPRRHHLMAAGCSTKPT